MITRFLLACTILVSSFNRVWAEDQSWVVADVREPPLSRQMANRIEHALRERTQCDFQNTPLEYVIEYLEQAHQIPIWIDKHTLQKEGVSPDQQVTVVKAGVTLQTALDLILDPLRLAHVTQGGVLHITTQQKADEIYSVRVYPVADLISEGEDGTNFMTLMNVIQQTSSAKWIEIDQEGGAIAPYPKAKSLVIRQTEREHRVIEWLFVALRQANHLQNLSSIPTNRDGATQLNPIEPISEVQLPRLRVSRSTRSWQQPRIHLSD